MNAARLTACLCLALLTAVCLPRARAQLRFLEQNWDDLTRQMFYTTSQGSRLLPYEWFLAIEVSDGTASFLKTRVPQLGYLPNGNTLNNPDALPVGFVVDRDWSGRKHLGLTCAACHTNHIQYQGRTYQIDGAPTLADMWGLLAGIRDSLNATATQEPKFARFAHQVLGPTATVNQMTELRNDLSTLRAYWQQFIADSMPDPTGKLTWGRGRLDAFGMIFNRVTSIDLNLPANSSRPNAPVSYPFLWGTSFEDRVQWNASAPNRNDVERLGRNVGEVLGVFAAADLQKPLFHLSVRTSARRLHQLHIENWLKRLWSPAWPADFPPIDDAKKQAGKTLFQQHCVSCHPVIDHGKQDTPVVVARVPVNDVGTDSMMALNAIQRMADTGRLNGALVLNSPEPLPARTPTATLLVDVVIGAVISPFHDIDTVLQDFLSLPSHLGGLVGSSIELSHDEVQELMQQARIESPADFHDKLVAYRKFIDEYNSQLVDFVKQAAQVGLANVQMDSNPYVYKARPLDGIWATAPYLHNGSVPNLYELLLPANQRSKTFHVGSSEFDPVNVGFKSDANPGTTEIDTHVQGNLNTGHEYGVGAFSEEQRKQLLEYLKSL